MKKTRNPYDEIVKVAYDLYEKRGRVHGYDLEDWLEAERIVLEKSGEEIAREAKTVKAAKGKKSLGKAETETVKPSKKSSEGSSKTTKKKSPAKSKIT